jgi:hypothetical protein
LALEVQERYMEILLQLLEEVLLLLEHLEVKWLLDRREVEQVDKEEQLRELRGLLEHLLEMLEDHQ